MLIEYFHNEQKNTGEYPRELRHLLNLEHSKAAFDEIKTWNGYTRTPLHSLKKIASEVGVKSIYYKD